jgi:hypothetical protein
VKVMYKCRLTVTRTLNIHLKPSCAVIRPVVVVVPKAGRLLHQCPSVVDDGDEARAWPVNTLDRRRCRCGCTVEKE